MNFQIAHELPGRIRLRPVQRRFAEKTLNDLVQRIQAIQTVDNVRGSVATGSILIFFNGGTTTRETILQLVKTEATQKVAPFRTLSSPWHGDPVFKSLIISLVALVIQFMIPAPWRLAILVVGCWPTLKKGMQALVAKKVDSDLLDATAIIAALFIKDYTAAGSITVLLQFGEILDNRTRLRTVEDQREHFPVGPEWTWIRRGDQTVRVATSELDIGDEVIANAGTVITVDGIVQEGNALVQEASLTGNSLPQSKNSGDRVLAGTIVEQGELLISVSSRPGETRAAQIEQIIQTSWQRMGKHESLAQTYADRLAPPVLALSALTFLLTGNVRRAVAVLLVDFSCALKLSIPLAINHTLSVALREAIIIKGGKALEALSKADTFVLDKTGTLTTAQPQVSFVRTYNGYDKDFVLRQTACLEEHFPHPMANAVVKEAEKLHLEHGEEHGRITLRVASGLESELNGERILVGSRKFLEDSGIDLTACEYDERSPVQQGMKLLYVAIGHQLVGLMGLENSIRSDAADFVKQLKASKARKLVLLTGDSIESARRVGGQIGITDVIAAVLPLEKHEYIKRLRAESPSVCMVGDGMNDSPALLLADVGVALNDGSELAKECADIIILDNRLLSIVRARNLSCLAMARIRTNLIAIASVNSGLLALGAFGLFSPVAAALCHNLTTVGVTMNALRPYASSH